MYSGRKTSIWKRLVGNTDAFFKVNDSWCVRVLCVSVSNGHYVYDCSVMHDDVYDKHYDWTNRVKKIILGSNFIYFHLWYFSIRFRIPNFLYKAFNVFLAKFSKNDNDTLMALVKEVGCFIVVTKNKSTRYDAMCGRDTSGRVVMLTGFYNRESYI